MAKIKTKTVVTITHNRFPEIAAKLPNEADKVVRKTSFDIERDAKIFAPVDTGALENSIYVKTDKSSGYNGAVQDAKTANPDVKLLPEMANPGAHTAVIGPAVEYGIYPELGTRNPNYPKQPYMTPAAERHKPKFEEAVRQMLDRL